MKSWQTPKPWEEFGAIWQTASSDTVLQDVLIQSCLWWQSAVCWATDTVPALFPHAAHPLSFKSRQGCFCGSKPQGCFTTYRIILCGLHVPIVSTVLSEKPLLLNSDPLCPLQHLSPGLLFSFLQWSNSCVIQEVILALFHYFTLFFGLA